jgi:hypothetical protein
MMSEQEENSSPGLPKELELAETNIESPAPEDNEYEDTKGMAPKDEPDALDSESIASADDPDEIAASNQRTLGLINFSKRLLGRYVVLHKTVAIIFMTLHGCLTIVTILKALNTGSILSEPLLCHYTRPIMYIWYTLYNVFILGFYLVNYIEAKKVEIHV